MSVVLQLQSVEVEKLQCLEVGKLQSVEVRKLQSVEVEELQSVEVGNHSLGWFRCTKETKQDSSRMSETKMFFKPENTN